MSKIEIKDNGVKVIHLDCQMLEEHTTIDFDRRVNKLTVDKYWDSHGHMVDWGQETYRDVNVRMETNYQRKLIEGTEYEFEFHNLYVNNERLDGDVSELTRIGNVCVVSMCMGQG